MALCLSHITNLTVSKDQKYLIALITLRILDILDELLQNRTKICWATEVNLWQCLSVCLGNLLYTIDLRIILIAIYCKTVTCVTTPGARWNSTKPIEWEHFVAVIRLYDFSDTQNSLLILIFLRTKVV